MVYEQVYSWVKCMDSISRKVRCINWLLKSPDGSAPVFVKYRRGCYDVCVAGCLFASVPVYDVSCADTALERLSALYDGLWFARRASFQFTTS